MEPGPPSRFQVQSLISIPIPGYKNPDSRLDSEAPRIQREEIKPAPERVRKKSRKKTAEPAVTSLKGDRSASSSGGHHGDLATQVKEQKLRKTENNSKAKYWEYVGPKMGFRLSGCL